MLSIISSLNAILIHPVIYVIEAIRSVIVNFFWITCYCGYCLVQAGSYICKLLCDVYQIGCIVGEELVRFFVEVRSIASEVSSYIHDGAYDGWQLVYRIVNLIFQKLYDFARTTQVNTRLWAIATGGAIWSIIRFIFNILDGIAQFIIWLIMLIPNGIVRLLDWLIKSLEDLLINLNAHGSRILNTTFRLCIALSVLLVLHMFRKYVFMYSTYMMREIGLGIRAKLQGVLAWFKILKITPTAEEEITFSDAICVICLVSRRSIVLLPCRHLCICNECSEVLCRDEFDDRCPVCRHLIQSRMPVYI